MDFSGRVAIVTGAGRGLGRSYAVQLASRGCAVVVNDLGGAPNGVGGESARPADEVVAEIKAAGGKAVASYVSVEDGRSIVQTALDTWGRIDVLVCNAGIAGGGQFHEYPDDEWQREISVHLTGTYSVLRAAWPYLRASRYGRIVVTSSIAGLFGIPGVAGYCAGKAGVIGLARSLAMEGFRRNIKVNVVAPMSASRLVAATGASQDFLTRYDPRYVAAIVSYLCHESCEATGCIYEAGGGWYARTEMIRAKGLVIDEAALRDPSLATPEMVRDGFKEVMDVTAEGSETPGIRGVMKPQRLMKELNERAAASKL